MRGALLCSLLAACLAGCGGSGGGGSGSGSGSESSNAGAAATILAFPLAAAYKAYFANGSAQNYVISGACSGTALIENAPAVAASFDGNAGYSSTSRSAFDAPGCGLVGESAPTVQYVDPSYRLLGFDSLEAGYGKYEAPAGLPAFVSVGEAGTVGTQRLYLDPTRFIATGKTVLSYAVDADTPGSVVVRFITQTYSSADRLQATQTIAYRLGNNGSFMTLSSRTHYETGGGDLVLTPR